nr:MAG TPA: hypothetical protein [Bacteriophage sp.]DAR16794.1 MAG TPA: hypothetical protein [Caudoviricetes sp.]
MFHFAHCIPLVSFAGIILAPLIRSRIVKILKLLNKVNSFANI